MWSSDRLVLREFTAGDETAVDAFASDPKVVEYEGWGPNRREDTRAFLELTRRERLAEPRVAFTLAAVRCDTAELIGSVGVWVESQEHGRGALGLTFHRAHWGRGFATEATAMLVQLGFSRLGIRRMEATCDALDGASARVLQKAGFDFEGTSRQHMVMRDGRLRDTWRFVLFRPPTAGGRQKGAATPGPSSHGQSPRLGFSAERP